MKEYIYPEFEDSLELAYNRKTLDILNRGVGTLFINDYITIKYSKLSLPIYNKIQYLPKDLVRDYLKKEIFRANKIIEEKPEWSIFDRPTLFTIENEDQHFSKNQYTDLETQINSFLSSEVFEYLNYSIKAHKISNTNLHEYSSIGNCFPINLPKINELIDYLAYLRLYKWLVESYKGHTIEYPTQINTLISLDITITDSQKEKLFDLLIENKYIASNTHKESFKWAFSSQKKPIANWEPIKWIDISPTRQQSNMQTLYELLYLLKIGKDTSPQNPLNIYRKIKCCFRDSKNKELKDIESKNPHGLSRKKTNRKSALEQIISEVMH